MKKEKKGEKSLSKNNENKNVADVSVKEKTRDMSAELVRVVACLLVILTHISLQVYNDHIPGMDWSRLFEKCFLTDGVPLFFMLTGFFIANGRTLKKIWKSTIFKVIIPSLIYILVCQSFYMWFINKESFMWCLKNAITNSNIIGIIRTILTGNLASINSLCEHLWYIFSYVKIIIFVPVLFLICKDEKYANISRKCIIIFGFIALLITDVQKFVTIPNIGEIKVFEMLDKEFIYVLLGYELFLKKDKILGNYKLSIVSLIILVVANILRYKLEQSYMIMNHFTSIANRVSFMEWKYTCINVITGVCMFNILYSINIKNEMVSKIIKLISSYSFGIYLVHYAIIAKIDLYKFEIFGLLWQEILYLIVGLIATLAMSMIVIFIIRIIKSLFKKGYRKIFVKES